MRPMQIKGIAAFAGVGMAITLAGCTGATPDTESPSPEAASDYTTREVTDGDTTFVVVDNPGDAPDLSYGAESGITLIEEDVDGSQYYIFDYPAGPVDESGVGGGLAYFLAVQITIAIAQVINFFAQRNITFKANNSVAKAAFWYVIAYILITIGAAAAQGFYKAPIYSWTMEVWPSGGEAVADVITMIINAAIAFWIFFPIFKVIFKNTPDETVAPATVSQTTPETLDR